MKRLVLVAAFVASGFAVPVLPAAAAPALTDSEVNCLIFPALKKECWEKGAEMLKATPKAVAAATETTATTLKLPTLWTCTAAPKGSGHLLDC
ncbi:hypothetical protein VW23_026010 [Devosia insulae DS-56]|uniref:Secreted protein n=1 Tax=Devosia insulae DS-56 TaxID=1116389 RepID=A0A1E5XLJ5_9HYPH|nr:hypothetical protein [Devosia insulae]OEO29476.1 hypothetical protein VW23_026010 [Devosia insulae DS-56]